MADPILLNGSGGAQDKYGVIACEQIYEVDDEPTCLSYKPATAPFDLPIIERQWRMQPHGSWHVTIKYEGVQDVTSTDGNAFYEGDSGDSEDPIETFPGIDALVAQFDKQPDNGDGRIIWTQTMQDDKGNTVRNPMFGVDSYVVAMPTWTETLLYAQLPDDLYAHIDQIFNNPPGPGGNPPPTPPNSDPPDWPKRNWLLRRIVPRMRGNIWQVQKTWMQSGPGGWNTNIYSDSGS